MKIKLSYTGYLKLVGARNGDIVEVPEGASISDVMTQFGIPAHQQRHLIPFVNGDEQRKLNTSLNDGDELTLVIQIGGGSAG